ELAAAFTEMPKAFPKSPLFEKRGLGGLEKLLAAFPKSPLFEKRGLGGLEKLAYFATIVHLYNQKKEAL
ncbi:MAG: hypothetical protein IPN94_17630, partial [Sphingobacteriales bacterium]|nr:hypothetical protein [Sphingobacteriales bacterium]